MSGSRLTIKYWFGLKENFFIFKQEMSLKKTNGVGLKKEENITQG